MSQDDQKLSMRSRRALNSLQYSPNGKDVVGLSPRKPRLSSTSKKVDLGHSNSPLMKTRTSISLPDISSKSLVMKSAITSTPYNGQKTHKSPLKSNARKNISVILEEKENPGAVSVGAKQASSRSKTPRCKHASLQCNLVDELMVTADDVDMTPYWKLMAHKRLAALVEAEQETIQVNQDMAELHEENEKLRDKIAKYKEILRQYDELKNQILESIDCCDDEEDDSGYERSNLSVN